MDCHWEDRHRREGYWGLFWETGAPEFYLLGRDGAAQAEKETDAPPAPAGG